MSTYNNYISFTTPMYYQVFFHQRFHTKIDVTVARALINAYSVGYL